MKNPPDDNSGQLSDDNAPLGPDQEEPKFKPVNVFATGLSKIEIDFVSSPDILSTHLRAGLAKGLEAVGYSVTTYPIDGNIWEWNHLVAVTNKVDEAKVDWYFPKQTR